MLIKPIDISSQWGQSLISADCDMQPRTESITVPFSEGEMKALGHAAAMVGTDDATFIRALFLRWFHDNWQSVHQFSQKQVS